MSSFVALLDGIVQLKSVPQFSLLRLQDTDDLIRAIKHTIREIK